MKLFRENRTTWRTVVAIAVLMFLVLGCGGSDEADDMTSRTRASEPTVVEGDASDLLAAAAEWLGTDVPASAENFRYAEEFGGMDDAARIRFDLPKSDFDGFLEALNMGRELSPGRHGFPSMTDPDWMNTSELSDFVGAPSTGRNPATNITADVSAADIVTVYIQALDF